MSTQVTTHPAALSHAKLPRRIGVPAGIALSVFSTAGFLLGIFTPPRLRPWCLVDCTAYPFADAARFFPRDYFWMLPAVCLAPLFVVLAACVHSCLSRARQIFTLLAVCCATASATVIALDYAVQVLAVQPSLEIHETEAIAFFSQYNPLGLFLVAEDLGYLLLASAMACVGIALPASRPPARALQLSLGVVAGAVSAAVVLLAVRYRTVMALPLELTVVSLVWIGLIPTGILLARWFAAAARES